MHIRFAAHHTVAALALSVGLPTLCLAQPASTRSRIQIVHVRADMVNEWLDLQKNEVVPVLKKGGWKSRTVYNTSIGNGQEYVIIRPFDKYAEFDADGAQVKVLGAVAAARLAEKLRKCILNTSNYVSTRLADLSTAIDGSAPPARIVTTRIRVAPGKMEDLQNVIKAELTPGFKKAKLPITVSRRGMGANPNDLIITSPISKYADLDGESAFQRALGGREAAARVFAKFTGLATPVETLVRTRVAELSF